LQEIAILKEPGGTRGELWKGRELLMQVKKEHVFGTTTCMGKSGLQRTHLTREGDARVSFWFY